MHVITKVLSVLVALEFLYIFYLETLATTSEKTSSVFGMTTEELSQKNVKVLFKNQGVYNGLLSVLILLAVFAFASKCGVRIRQQGSRRYSDGVHCGGCSVWKPDQQSEDHPDAGRTGHSDADLLYLLSGTAHRSFSSPWGLLPVGNNGKKYQRQKTEQNIAACTTDCARNNVGSQLTALPQVPGSRPA